MQSLGHLAAGVTVALTLFGDLASATGPLNGLPILNGPIPIVPETPGMKKSVGDFVHPGLWHTHDDLERIRLGVANKQEPWASAYANFSKSSYSQATVGVDRSVTSGKLTSLTSRVVSSPGPKSSHLPGVLQQLHDLHERCACRLPERLDVVHYQGSGPLGQGHLDPG